VDEVVIRVTWPRRSAEGKRVEDFQSNLALEKVEGDRHTRTYEGRFTEVPADIFAFSLETGRPGRLGFTLHPAYKLAFPDVHHAFAVALELDVLIRNFQLSVGAQYGTVDTFQLLQEVKMFPPGGGVVGLAALFDYRFALGVVEQILPHADVGFRFSAGMRVLVALELSYQMFPPLITDSWTHEMLIGMPFSF
jgi:hypothetical protein